MDPEEPEGSSLLIFVIGGIILLLLLGFGAYFLLFGWGSNVQEKPNW
jgi:hypothetical protein